MMWDVISPPSPTTAPLFERVELCISTSDVTSAAATVPVTLLIMRMAKNATITFRTAFVFLSM